MFSATIDQMRLRVATALPFVCQNASSSGRHSEIQRDMRKMATAALFPLRFLRVKSGPAPGLFTAPKNCRNTRCLRSGKAMRPKLVLVGNGMAGIACLDQVLALAPDRYAVTVFGDEDHPNYNRILLSSLLAGEATWDDVTLNPESWYREREVDLFKGVRVQ